MNSKLFRYMPFCLFFSIVCYLYLSILFNSALWSTGFTESYKSSSNLRATNTLVSANNRIEVILASKSTADMIPEIIYGTAWKKERTAQLVEQAIRSGFRAIDTACQPKHYYEKGVGDALIKLVAENVIKREDVFIQTKFTSIRGQDPNSIPYDRNAPLSEQVMQSFAKSCENLRTSYIDSLVMHSPMETLADTLTVWKTFEEIYKKGGVKYLGLSNTYNLKVLEAVYDGAEIKPSFLQNRFYADSGYDVQIREYCRSHGIKYQSFWTLTANPHIIKHPIVQSIAEKYSKTPAQVFFRFVQQIDMIPLSGTTSVQHMQEDVSLGSFSLEPNEVDQMQRLLR